MGIVVFAADSRFIQFGGLRGSYGPASSSDTQTRARFMRLMYSGAADGSEILPTSWCPGGGFKDFHYLGIWSNLNHHGYGKYSIIYREFDTFEVMQDFFHGNFKEPNPSNATQPQP